MSPRSFRSNLIHCMAILYGAMALPGPGHHVQASDSPITHNLGTVKTSVQSGVDHASSHDCPLCQFLSQGQISNAQPELCLIVPFIRSRACPLASIQSPPADYTTQPRAPPATRLV